MKKFSTASLPIVILMTALVGCSSKPVAPEVAAKSMKDVVDQPLNLAADGSDSGKIDGLASIHFSFDQHALDAAAKALIEKNSQWMRQNVDYNLEVEGHTDRHGSAEYNLALGERRAKAIKLYLENLGVPADRLSMVSYGKEKMLDAADTEEADAMNRRGNLKPILRPATLKSASLQPK